MKKIFRIIKEGEQLPFLFGMVGIRLDYFHGYEIAPIPLNYIKRWWYKTIREFHLSKWEQDVEKAREESYREGYHNGSQEEYDRIYKRGKDAFDAALPVLLSKKKTRDQLKTLIGAYEKGNLNIKKFNL